MIELITIHIIKLKDFLGGGENYLNIRIVNYMILDLKYYIIFMINFS